MSRKLKPKIAHLNRTQAKYPKLYKFIKQTGVTIKKAGPGFVLVLGLSVSGCNVEAGNPHDDDDTADASRLPAVVIYDDDDTSNDAGVYDDNANSAEQRVILPESDERYLSWNWEGEISYHLVVFVLGEEVADFIMNHSVKLLSISDNFLLGNYPEDYYNDDLKKSESENILSAFKDEMSKAGLNSKHLSDVNLFVPHIYEEDDYDNNGEHGDDNIYEDFIVEMPQEGERYLEWADAKGSMLYDLFLDLSCEYNDEKHFQYLKENEEEILAIADSVFLKRQPFELENEAELELCRNEILTEMLSFIQSNVPNSYCYLYNVQIEISELEYPESNVDDDDTSEDP